MTLLLGTQMTSWANPPRPEGGRNGAAALSTIRSASDGGPPTGGPTTVTLVTGDRVTVYGTRTSVRPGPGRSKMRFLTTRTGRSITVVPHDALPLLRAGRLDPRLFDVTELVRFGYDDTTRNSLPLLVTFGRHDARRPASRIDGAQVIADLPAIGGAAVEASKAHAGEVWTAVTRARARIRAGTAGEIEKIWLDGQRELSLDHSVPQIGAPAAYQAGLTGRGVRVAVLDTGVDDDHPDLTVAEARNFTEMPDATDDFGHGTHVASIIAGNGAASGGRYRGVAPDATLLSGKICTRGGCRESAILAGMQWAAVDMRAAVINLSLGSHDTPGVDPLEQAINTLTAQTGALFVVAAGNDNPIYPVSSPSTADAALSVGAVDASQRLAGFSSVGPRSDDGGIKPDLTAPGVDIAAARAAGTLLGIPLPGGRYMLASGTSMASPHVAGAAALLAQQHPDWNGGQLKAALMGSATPQPSQTSYQQGAGRVDVARAVAQAVVAEPASVSFGVASWPHDDDGPIRRTVSYRNLGASTLTLHVAAEVTGPAGQPAPGGMFRLSADRLTVPAGGNAEIEIVVDTRFAGSDGTYSGRLVARAETKVLTTPLAVDKEVESYTLRVNHLDRAGAPTPYGASDVVRLDGGRGVYDVADKEADGTGEVRLPKGRYGLHGLVWTDEPSTITQLVAPDFLLDGDTTLTVDARLGKPVRVTVPEPSAAPVMGSLSAVFHPDSGGGDGTVDTVGYAVDDDSFDELYIGRIGPPGSGDRFESWIDGQWADPDQQYSPYLYAVAETFPGRAPDGFTHAYQPDELATVTHEFRGRADSGGDRSVFAAREGSRGATLGVPIPGKRIEHHNVSRTGWVAEMIAGATYLESRPVTYQAGRQYRDLWNAAPFGPTLATRWSTQGIVRQGDRITADVPLFADAADHPGYPRVDSSRIALYRDGELVGEYTEPQFGLPTIGKFLVPAAVARYRLEVSAGQSSTELSTEVRAAWTFSSQRSDDTLVKLPASTIRFAPALDAEDSAPAGRAFEIPIRVESQPGTPCPTNQRPTVEISYDGGKTWRKAALRADRDAWVATVTHPSGPGYASLRATATDGAGNSVTQTVIRAYRLR